MSPNQALLFPLIVLFVMSVCALSVYCFVRICKKEDKNDEEVNEEWRLLEAWRGEIVWQN